MTIYTNNKMRNTMKHLKHISSVSLLLASSFFLLTGCAAKKTEEKAESISDIQRREGVPVRIIAAKDTSIEEYEMLGGTAEGYIQTTLSAGMAGKISVLNVKVGDFIAQDASLMTIAPDMPQNYEVVKQQVENAQKSKDRITALAAQGGVPQQVIDDVNTSLFVAKEGLESVRKSQFVLAPFSGTIVNVFQMINSIVGHSTDLATIAKIEKIRVPLTVSDIMINRFKIGQKAFAVTGTDTIEGMIEKVALAGVDANHTFKVEAVFENPKRILKPAMYVPVKVITATKANAITLPLDAVIADGSRKYVYIINGDVATSSNVATGIRSGNVFEIVAGVQVNDKIVVSGSSLLFDGTKVKVVN
jgi:membrane fusion protein, multidrug efflux system